MTWTVLEPSRFSPVPHCPNSEATTGFLLSPHKEIEVIESEDPLVAEIESVSQYGVVLVIFQTEIAPLELGSGSRLRQLAENSKNEADLKD